MSVDIFLPQVNREKKYSEKKLTTIGIPGKIRSSRMTSTSSRRTRTNKYFSSVANRNRKNNVSKK